MVSSPKADSQYIVGIDLGTTNSAVCYVDTAVDSQVQVLAIPQLVAPGQVESRQTLPSFHYQPVTTESQNGQLDLPWAPVSNHCVGAHARDHGIHTPSRLISSAKSWLCHPNVDRTAGILPWQGGDDVDRLSPVEVSARLLRHISNAWNHIFPQSPLAQQTVVLTIPASFDEVARNLTIQAAHKAGLPRVLLIEEPQAAFYAWMNRNSDNWQSLVTAGQKILVCDIGGGTSDFTLIRVRHNSDGEIMFHRVAVGEHLILGGDNLDLALAHFIEGRFQEEGTQQLTPRQWSVLVRVARQVKENLLSADKQPLSQFTVSLPGTGSSLIGGSLQTTVTAQEISDVLLEGFLPKSSFDDSPRQMQSGFREFGLPYAADSAMTRYLADFLRRHAETAVDNTMLNDDADPARPDIVLYNGGLFESPVLQQRMTETISSWFSHDHQTWQPTVLDCQRLDLAVAHGAAVYGLVSRGEGVRISAGLPRTYYVQVQSQSGPSAVCLIPAGTEPGVDLSPPSLNFELKTDEPVEFPILYSATRLTDDVGTLLSTEKEQLTALPPIRTVIRSKTDDSAASLNVQLNGRLTEIGTLDLWCSSATSNERWKLQFDVRSAVRTDLHGHVTGAADAEGVIATDTVDRIAALLKAIFGKNATEKPAGLARRIGREIGLSRAEWPTSLLREIWRILFDLADGRRRSPAHESSWLNVAGFALRPGFGYAMDDWRVAETWDQLRGKLIHSVPEVRNQWWIFWRRVAGGLSGGQQSALANPLLSSIRQTHQQMKRGKGKGGALSLHEKDATEIWRALGAFEQLPPSIRRELGDIIADFIPRPRMQPVLETLVWTLGRVGSRVPLNGNAQSTVSADAAAAWAESLLSLNDSVTSTQLALMQLTRRTNDRLVDVNERTRKNIAAALRDEQHHALATLVMDGGELDSEIQQAVFGDSLPLGLAVRS